MPDGQLNANITIDQIRSTLGDAGINLAVVTFGGATSCAVNRIESPVDAKNELDEWVDARQAVPASQTQSPQTSPAPAVAPPPAATSSNTAPLHSLRDILTSDLCRRLELDPATVQIAFNSADDKVLNLAEPYFEFEVSPRRVRILNDLAWEVTIVSNGQRMKATILASASVWQTEAIMVNPVDFQQVIRDEDVQEKRTLSNQLPTEPLLTKAQAVGQQAARVLKPGTILTSRMVDPAMLAHAGQLITVNVVHGTMRITAVAKALEDGCYGQTIKARNDVDPTKTFEVTLTGPQEGTVTGATRTGDSRILSPLAEGAN
jgi:flagella basal body P-ring formation protein FlgA